ncbi:MAG TPA: CoA pyrophosphatase [Gemmatimonadales bacterium]|nr:CoA pyrophosphatase [Gemmatimonadales bacterium]
MSGLDLVRRALAAVAPVADHDPAARPAAVAMILHQSADDLEALFIKRAARAGDPWSGQIAFPGGRFEPTDADLLATAMRETREETGIDLRVAEQLGVLDDLNPRTPTLPPIVVRPFVFGVGARPALALSPDEVERAFWLPFTELGRAGVRKEITLTLRGAPRVFPAYDLGEDVIWGMTERILTSFLARLGPGE